MVHLGKVLLEPWNIQYQALLSVSTILHLSSELIFTFIQDGD